MTDRIVKVVFANSLPNALADKSMLELKSKQWVLAAIWCAVSSVGAVARAQSDFAPQPLEQPIMGQQVSPGPTVGGLHPPLLRLRTQSEENGFDGTLIGLEGFLPILQHGGDALTFFDVRGFVVKDLDSEHEDRNGLNVGLAHRWFVPEADRTMGASLFYDHLSTGPADFEQIGFGLDSFGRQWDFHFNGYVPLGEKRQKTLSIARDPQFVGSGIDFTRFEQFQTALQGFDFEVGRLLATEQRLQFRAFAGLYYYDDKGLNGAVDGAVVDLDTEAVVSDGTLGFQGRLETRWERNAFVNLNLQHDDTFGTTVSINVLLNMPFLDRRPQPWYLPAERLGDPIHRRQYIAIRTDSTTMAEAAINPDTGVEQVVWHVDNSNAGAADGSVDNPFVTLGDAETASAAHDFIVVRAGGSAYMNEGFVLKDGQRLLGVGGDLTHTFTAEQGTFILPGAPNTTVLPTIENAPNANLGAVVVASDSEVAGFTINAPQTAGVYGNSASNVNIRAVTINNATNQGVFLDGGDQVVIDQLKITASGSVGIHTASVNDLTIRDAEIADSMEQGIFLDTGSQIVIDGATVNASGTAMVANKGAAIHAKDVTGGQFRGVNIDTAAEQGILLEGGENLVVNEATIAMSTMAGIEATGIQVLELRNVTINNSMMQGILATGITERMLVEKATVSESAGVGLEFADVTGDLTVTGGAFTANDGGGIYGRVDDGELTLSITNNMLDQNGSGDVNSHGIRLELNSPKLVRVNLDSNSITNSMQNAIDIALARNGMPDDTTLVIVNNNMIDNSMKHGMNFSLSEDSDSQFLVTNNMVQNSTDKGVMLLVADRAKITSAVRGNTMSSGADQDNFYAEVDDFGQLCLQFNRNTGDADNDFVLLKNPGADLAAKFELETPTGNSPELVLPISGVVIVTEPCDLEAVQAFSNSLP